MPSEEETTGTSDGAGGEPPKNPAPPPADPDALGDAGKRALDSERQARREAEAKLKELQAKLDEATGATKSDMEKLTDQVQTATQAADKANGSLLRLEVALDQAPEGMSIAQVRKLAKRLAGSTREELEADAEELFGDFGGTKPPSERPTPAPKGGNDPTGDDNVDVDAMAERIAAGPMFG
jgi:hypothetical protein